MSVGVVGKPDARGEVGIVVGVHVSAVGRALNQWADGLRRRAVPVVIREDKPIGIGVGHQWGAPNCLTRIVVTGERVDGWSIRRVIQQRIEVG